MNEKNANISDTVLRLIDDYVAGALNEAETADLDRALCESAAARAYFVRFCKFETDLQAAVRAQAAASRAMASITKEDDVAKQDRATPRLPRRPWRQTRAWLAASVLLMIAASATVWFTHGRPDRNKSASVVEVAWLVNAQDCEWDTTVAGGLVPGRTLGLRTGLAELHMGNGAKVVLQGRVDVQLVAADTLRITRGKLSVRAEGAARGFQVLVPQGRVLDLGTEFGVSVDSDGSAKITVFEGKVAAFAGTGNASASTTLTRSQSAEVSRQGVKVVVSSPAATQPSDIARQIKRTPIVVAHHFAVDFNKPAESTLLDAVGRPTGLTHRLPGTGDQLAAHDANLRFDSTARSLCLTTTRSDLNHRFKLSDGEYLGLCLSDLGFTGDEDFEVSMVVPNIPALAAVGQFGLYAGVRNDLCIRGGVISQRAANRYSQFLVNNEAGLDQNAMFVGLVETGNDVRLTLRRRAGDYSLTVENLTSGASSTLSIRPLAALAGQRQMFVGFFGANIGSEQRQTLSITDFSVTVWTRQ